MTVISTYEAQQACYWNAMLRLLSQGDFAAGARTLHGGNMAKGTFARGYPGHVPTPVEHASGELWRRCR